MLAATTLPAVALTTVDHSALISAAASVIVAGIASLAVWLGQRGRSGGATNMTLTDIIADEHVRAELWERRARDLGWTDKEPHAR